MGKITFVPVGGLANRMRAVASAVMLAGKTKSELSIIWFQDWALNAPFYQLFKPVDEGGNLAASKIRNLECPNYEICLIDYGCGKFNRKIHIMEQYP